MLKKIFDEDVVLYDNYRPHYSARLFDDIFYYSKINRKSKVIEIGIGTGIATEPFLRKGIQVCGIDISQKMINYSFNKYSAYPNFSGECAEFEKIQIENESIDLFYSATAFHWINPIIGFNKMYNALKTGGAIALFWNYPFVAKDNDPLHQKIQNVYRYFEDKGLISKSGKQIEDNIEKYAGIMDETKKYGFEDVELKTFKSIRTFNADDYIKLLNTYSNHKSLPKDVKLNFENQIKILINENGGIIKVYDTNVLILARKK